MRAALFACLLLAACGPKSAPSNTATTGTPGARPDAGATTTPSDPGADPGPRATREDCTRVVDHVYAVILADRSLTDEQRQKVVEQKPMASETMLRQCADEFTRADVECYLSRRDLVEMMKACEKKQHHDRKGAP